MENKVANLTSTPDPMFGQKPTAARSDGPKPAPVPAPSADPADMRLIIEEDPASGSYIYTTINRRTGDVVQQLPREHVLKLSDRAEYVAGQVIRAKA
jgi:flagellar protein FlaG